MAHEKKELSGISVSATKRLFRTGFVLLALLLMCPTIVRSVPEPERTSAEYFGPDADFFQGKDLYLRSETLSARSYLEKYLKGNPQGRFTVESRFLLAITETDAERAKDGFWQLYRDKPEETLGRLSYFQYGCLLLLSGQYADASEVFEHLALTGVNFDEGLVLQKDFLPLNVMDIPGYGVDGLYAVSLLLSDSVSAAENVLQQFSGKPSSQTSTERWQLLSGVLADKLGRVSEAQRLLDQLIASSPNSNVSASACYYALVLMRSGAGVQDRERFANHLARTFPKSPEHSLVRRSRSE